MSKSYRQTRPSFEVSSTFLEPAQGLLKESKKQAGKIILIISEKAVFPLDSDLL